MRNDWCEEGKGGYRSELVYLDGQRIAWQEKATSAPQGKRNTTTPGLRPLGRAGNAPTKPWQMAPLGSASTMYATDFQNGFVVESRRWDFEIIMIRQDALLSPQGGREKERSVGKIRRKFCTYRRYTGYQKIMHPMKGYDSVLCMWMLQATGVLVPEGVTSRPHPFTGMRRAGMVSGALRQARRTRETERTRRTREEQRGPLEHRALIPRRRALATFGDAQERPCILV